MKPFFIACLILVSLFTAGAMNQRTVSDISDSIRTQLNASQAAAQQEQWESAERALSQADRTWQATGLRQESALPPRHFTRLSRSTHPA